MYSRPVHGVVFLFKWKADDETDGSIVKDSRLDKIFFAKQVWEQIQFMYNYTRCILYLSYACGSID